MLILSWNLFHGRSVPESRHALQREFTAAIAGWAWDVALLQEVPPWWPPALAEACGAQQRTALTSRNWPLPLRRAIAVRRPDLIKSNGGGSNAILVRNDSILEHRTHVLRRRPERRVLHGVLLASGIWICNIHAQNSPRSEARKDIAEAGRAATAWSGDGPIVIGGDFNVPDPEIPGFERAPGSRTVDQVLVRGVEVGRARLIERGHLSDHAPVTVALAPVEVAGAI